MFKVSLILLIVGIALFLLIGILIKGMITEEKLIAKNRIRISKENLVSYNIVYAGCVSVFHMCHYHNYTMVR